MFLQNSWANAEPSHAIYTSPRGCCWMSINLAFNCSMQRGRREPSTAAAMQGLSVSTCPTGKLSSWVMATLTWMSTWSPSTYGLSLDHRRWREPWDSVDDWSTSATSSLGARLTVAAFVPVMPKTVLALQTASDTLRCADYKTVQTRSWIQRMMTHSLINFLMSMRKVMITPVPISWFISGKAEQYFRQFTRHTFWHV